LRLVSVLIAYKVFVVVLVLLNGQVWPDFFNVVSYKANFHWPEDKAAGLSERFTTWDGEHYLYLSQSGYEAGSASAAFYPLWPSLIGAGAKLLGGHDLIVALLLSNIFSLIACCLFHKLVKLRHTTQLADWATIFLLVYPGALFFQFAYTESLFFLLIILFFWGMAQRSMALVILAGLLLPMTRSVGLFCAVPLVVSNYLERRPWRDYVPLCAIAAGWFIYLLVMQVQTGNMFEGFAAQRHYIANGSISKLFDPIGFLTSLFRPLQMHGFLDSLFDRLFFASFIAALFILYRLNKVYFAYCIAVGLIPAIANSFMSYTRYLAVAFPVFIAIAQYFDAHERRYLRCTLAGVLFIIQVAFVFRHINFYWAG